MILPSVKKKKLKDIAVVFCPYSGVNVLLLPCTTVKVKHLDIQHTAPMSP